MARTYLGDWGTYYAKSGTSTPNSNDYQTRWYLSYEQDTANKQTTIYIQPYLKVYSVGGEGSILATITTTINGASKSQTIDFGDAFYTSGTKTKYGSTHSFVITHETDGTASCKFSGKMVSDVYVGSTNIFNAPTKTASHTWSLPTINVASTITNNTSSSSRINFGNTVTFAIARPNETVTHTLTYVENGQTVTIGTGIGESASYAFPTSYINNLPSATEKDYVITCTSSNGTVSTTTVYLKVPDSYKPSVSLAVTDGHPVTKEWGIWVQNKSILTFSLTPTLSAGSPIKTYYTKINDVPYYEQSQTLDKFNYTEKVTIVSNVTDYRNRTSTNQTKELTVYPYSNPTLIKCEVVRCDANGVEDNNGAYGKIKCSYSISPCNNKNAKSLVVTYGTGSTAQSKTITLSDYSANDKTSGSSYDFSGLSTTSNHTFTFKLTDSFTTTEQNYIMPPSFVLMSYYKGGKGITFGQIATAEGFHSHMDSTFHKLLTATKLNLKRIEYSPKTMSELVAYASSTSTSFNTGYSHVFWVNWSDYENYPGYAGMSGFYFQGTNSNSGYIFALPFAGTSFFVNCNIDGERWSGWKKYLSENLTVNNLTSTSTTYPLSAYQGKILNDKITAIPSPKELKWVTITTNKTWSQGTILTYENALEGAVSIWIGGKVLTSNTGLSSLLIPIPLITTTETNFLINDEAQWVRVGMYKDGNNLKVVDRGRGSDGNVSHIYVLKYA